MSGAVRRLEEYQAAAGKHPEDWSEPAGAVAGRKGPLAMKEGTDKKSCLPQPAARAGLAVGCVAGLMLLLAPWLPERGERFYAVAPVLFGLDALLFGTWRRSPRLLAALAGGLIGVLLFAGAGTVMRAGGYAAREGCWLAWYLAGILVVFTVARRAWEALWNCVWSRPADRPPVVWQVAVALSFGVVLSPYLLAAGNLHRPKRPNRTTPGALGLAYEDVPVTTEDGLRLPGWFIPCAGSDTAVLVVHGLGSNRADMLPTVRFLHDAGLHLFLFDLRSHGDSPGHTVTFGFREARDVAAAARVLAGRRDVRHILGYGFSMGTASLLQAVPNLPQVQSFVLDSPFADFPETAAYYTRPFLGRLSPLLVAAAEPFFWLDAGVTPGEIRPVDRVAAISPRPLFLIHGTADRLIPYQQSQALYQAAGQPKQLWLVEGAGHVEAHGLKGEEYEQRVVAFFRACRH